MKISLLTCVLFLFFVNIFIAGCKKDVEIKTGYSINAHWSNIQHAGPDTYYYADSAVQDIQILFTEDKDSLIAFDLPALEDFNSIYAEVAGVVYDCCATEDSCCTLFRIPPTDYILLGSIRFPGDSIYLSYTSVHNAGYPNETSTTVNASGVKF